MAGDWIKMRSNLWDDPRVSAIVDATDSSEAFVIGALYWLWASADQHTETGVMPGLSTRQIDRKTGLKGFGEALITIGWLADHPEGVRIISFEEHNGESAKRRSTDAKRKAATRSEDAAKWQRKGFSKNQKYRIFAMDGFKCVYCGRHKDDPIPANLDPSGYALSVDHLIPVCQGGDNSDDNVVTACLPCNMSKNGRTPEEWGVVPNLSERLRTFNGQVQVNSGARAELEKEKEKEKELKNTLVDGTPSTPVCPHQEIIDLYHEHCPTLATIKVWHDTRRKHLQARWREDVKRQSLDYWERFFRYVAQSPFLTGNPGPWKADLEWLVNSSNFVKVIEGKYHQESAA